MRNIIEAYADLLNLLEYGNLYLSLLHSSDNISSLNFGIKYTENNDNSLSRKSIIAQKIIFFDNYKVLVPKSKNYKDKDKDKKNTNVPRWTLPKTQNKLRKYHLFYAKASAASHNNIIFQKNIIEGHDQMLQTIYETLSDFIYNDLEDIVKKTWPIL